MANEKMCIGRKITFITDVHSVVVKNESAGLSGLDDGKFTISYLIYNNGGASITVNLSLQNSFNSQINGTEVAIPAYSKKYVTHSFMVKEGLINADTQENAALKFDICVGSDSANGLNMIPAGTEIIIAYNKTNGTDVARDLNTDAVNIEVSEVTELPDFDKKTDSFTVDKIDDFHISTAFGSHMVLQRDREVPVWGFSPYIGETVTVSFKGQTKTTLVARNGRWNVIFDSMPADKNGAELTATCNGKTETLTDVLVGDVFFLGGQSNADMPLSACRNTYSDEYKKQLIESGEGNIRFFRQGKLDAMANRETMNTPQSEPINGNVWTTETLSTANTFCAFGFFFGHKLYNEINVPIGMVMVASAGSPVSQLMSKEASDKTGYDRYENSIPVSGMYNALMSPFIKMSFKGMLYFQGESEHGLAKSQYGKYNEYLNAYVEDLREKNGYNFPFYYAQVSSYKVDILVGMGEQRAVMFDGLKVIENSGMIVTMDHGSRAGDPDWAHSMYKEPVGNRFANLTLAKLYGGNENYLLSPMPVSAEKTDKGVVITYKHVGNGLKRIGQHETLTGFKAITDAGYVNVNATIISENSVLLDTTNIKNLLGVGYGLEILCFVDYPEGNGDLTYVANLGNSEDLPCPTFKMFI